MFEIYSMTYVRIFYLNRTSTIGQFTETKEWLLGHCMV